jgi:hypothetical protein
MIITRTEFFLLPTTNNKKKITPSVQASSNCRKKNWLFVLTVCRVGVLMTIASIFFFAKQLSKAWNVFSPSRKQKFKRSVPIKYRPYHLARNE